MTKAKRREVALGLAVLETLAMPQGGYSLGEIAAVCGVSRVTVLRWEREALAKLRARAAWLAALEEAGATDAGRLACGDGAVTVRDGK